MISIGYSRGNIPIKKQPWNRWPIILIYDGGRIYHENNRHAYSSRELRIANLLEIRKKWFRLSGQSTQGSNAAGPQPCPLR